MLSNRWLFLPACTLLSLLTACSSLPPTLATDNDALITDYHQWLAQPSDTVNEVRLGGVIAQVTNLVDRTRIEMVNLPIDKAGKPLLTDEPQGRFIGYIDGFVDPIAYGQGRLVTFIGTTAQPETGTVGEFEYTFPVMKVRGSHLWRVEERVVIDDITPYVFPCRSFYCRHVEDFPRSGRVIQEVK
ncbi:Slp family lipoprotein [Vibrio metschnikovii]|nr:Slp family lipoprotein [Vibrio metschnikovii]EKO3653674.1 Slp family lipoprotein [Vibrio metschnikovii]EKO3911807.1 Slp family lipoprotein [Vibrio metschnikovii]